MKQTPEQQENIETFGEEASMLQPNPALNPGLMLHAAAAYGMANYLVAYKGLLVNREEGSLYLFEPGNTDEITKGLVKANLSARLFLPSANLPKLAPSHLLSMLCDATEFEKISPAVYTFWFKEMGQFREGSWDEQYDESAESLQQTLQLIYAPKDYELLVTRDPLNMAHFPQWASTVVIALEYVNHKMRLVAEQTGERLHQRVEELAVMATTLTIAFVELVELWVRRLKESGTE